MDSALEIISSKDKEGDQVSPFKNGRETNRSNKRNVKFLISESRLRLEDKASKLEKIISFIFKSRVQRISFLLIFNAVACCSFGENISLIDQKLTRILEAQRHFFDQASTIDDDSLITRAQDIMERYEALIQENQFHAYSRILYGKFLNQIGHHEKAIKYFSDADSINPNLAINKQQIANYLIRSNKIVDALPFMILATEIEPNTAIYHSSLGEFIYEYQEELIQSMDGNVTFLYNSMINSFQKAARLESGNFNYSLRYAQCYGDLNISRPEEALSAWERILVNFDNLSTRENQYINIQRAKWMIELGRKNEARVILKKINLPSLNPYKEKLLNRLIPKGAILKRR